MHFLTWRFSSPFPQQPLFTLRVAGFSNSSCRSLCTFFFFYSGALKVHITKKKYAPHLPCKKTQIHIFARLLLMWLSYGVSKFIFGQRIKDTFGSTMQQNLMRAISVLWSWHDIVSTIGDRVGRYWWMVMKYTFNGRHEVMRGEDVSSCSYHLKSQLWKGDRDHTSESHQLFRKGR